MSQYPDVITCWITYNPFKLEQLERLSSENTPCRPTIIHTIDSYWISTQKGQILRILRSFQNFTFLNFKKDFTHDIPSEFEYC